MSNEIQMGFGPSPRPEYVYLDAETQPYPWYFFKHNPSGEGGTREPIDQPALTGQVTNVTTSEKEYRGKPNPKVLFHVSAGSRNYILESGRSTAFTRCLVAALARMGPEHAKKTITIEPRAGDEKAVFANVYNPANGGKVTYTYPRDDQDVERLIAQVMAFFQPATPNVNPGGVQAANGTRSMATAGA